MDKEMHFLDHLEELRWRIIKSIAAVIICAVPCGIFWREIFDFIMIYPLRLSPPDIKIIYTAPQEAIILSLKIAVMGGLIIAIPIVFYQLWSFIGPGLYKNEKVIILPVVIVSSFSFLLGSFFSYLVVPYIINFLSQFGAGKMEAMFKTDEYLGFLIKIILAFGIVFEMPLISYLLTRAGILTPGYLIKKSKYAVLIIFVIAALLTPPDVISQCFLAVPLGVLYMVSILVSFLTIKSRRKKTSVTV